MLKRKNKMLKRKRKVMKKKIKARTSLYLHKFVTNTKYKPKWE